MGNLARLALVANLKTSIKLDQLGLLGTYHLLLAHKVLEQPEEHKHFYRDLRRRQPATFIMMDNSAVELQKHEGKPPLTNEQLVEAVKIVNADVLTLPDTLTDSQATIKNSVKAAKELQSTLPDWCSYMLVAQGTNVNEALNTVARTLEHTTSVTGQTRVRYLAVPRLLVDYVGSRREIIKRLKRYYLPIHLFGFSDNMRDDVECTRLPLVQGIDSAVPVRAGLAGIEISNPDLLVPKRSMDYLNYSGEINEFTQNNIQNFRRWISEGLSQSGEV